MCVCVLLDKPLLLVSHVSYVYGVNIVRFDIVNKIQHSTRLPPLLCSMRWAWRAWVGSGCRKWAGDRWPYIRDTLVFLFTQLHYTFLLVG